MRNRVWTHVSQYGRFIVRRSRHLDELHADMIELEHLPTRAKVIHIAADDPENLFCLSFQTIPDSSNGIAHILEHCVLCGSSAFPVRDPFFSMTRRSVNTFMNAFTGADFTCYPAASQNEKDFYNLLDVYIDAVFHPTLSELSFAQEGHRLEFETIDDPESPLNIKGVVYNEMKGSLSNPMRRLMEAISESLFPDTVYGKNSGGDPKEIPSLTLSELREFHSRYYHPSRCLFFFYGNIPLEQHLDFIESKALKDVVAPQEGDFHHEIQLQPRFHAPRRRELHYPLSSEEASEYGAYYALGWLTGSINNQLEALALTILDIVLMETDAALLKKELLASKLCRQASSSIDTESKEIPYILVMSGLKEVEIPKLHAAVFDALKKIAAEGVSDDLVESALHQVQIDRSEIGSDGTPFGFTLYTRAALLAHHHSDPIWGLTIHSLFQELRQRLKTEPRYFSQLIEKYLLTNTHRIDITMLPSSTLAQKELEEEQAMLAQKRRSLSHEQIQEIITSSQALEKSQNEETDSSCLPTISLQDISKEIRVLSLVHERPLFETEKPSIQHGVNLYTHSAFTNNISYVDATIPLPKIDFSDMWILRLITVLLPQLGAGSKTYDLMIDEVMKKTGGISTALNVNCQVHSPHDFHPTWHLRGKALDHNVEHLFNILSTYLVSPRLDEKERIRDIIVKHYTNLHNAFSSSALKYASLACNRFLHKPAALQEAWYGLSYYKKLENLVKNYTTLEHDLIRSLEKVLEMMISYSHGIDVIISGQDETLSTMRENRLWGMLDIPQKITPPWDSSIIPLEAASANMEIFIVPQQVSFTSLSLPSVPYDSPLSPYLTLAGNLMDNTVLHKRVREQGGAYGSGAYLQSGFANFQFYSYRDPHIASTLAAFAESVEAMAEGHFDEEDLEEAKLEVIQRLDAPLSPGSRGDIAYGWMKEGKTAELRKWFRNAILDATPENIIAAVKKQFYSHEKPFIHTAAITSCTGQETFMKERDALKNMGLSIHDQTIM